MKTFEFRQENYFLLISAFGPDPDNIVKKINLELCHQLSGKKYIFEEDLVSILSQANTFLFSYNRQQKLPIFCSVCFVCRQDDHQLFCLSDSFILCIDDNISSKIMSKNLQQEAGVTKNIEIPIPTTLLGAFSQNPNHYIGKLPMFSKIMILPVTQNTTEFSEDFLVFGDNQQFLTKLDNFGVSHWSV